MNTWVCLASFLLGACGGFLAAGRYFDEKYRKIADEEVESVKEAYGMKKETKAEEKDGVSVEIQTQHNRIMQDAGYIPKSSPYIVTPAEFGEKEDEGYETISLIYYSDGVLADEEHERVDTDMVIGSDALNHFGEYEEDSIYVRNDELKCDYEVLRDERAYGDG